MPRPTRGFHKGRCLPSCQDTQPKAGVRKVKEGEASETHVNVQNLVDLGASHVYMAHWEFASLSAGAGGPDLAEKG